MVEHMLCMYGVLGSIPGISMAFGVFFSFVVVQVPLIHGVSQTRTHLYGEHHSLLSILKELIYDHDNNVAL